MEDLKEGRGNTDNKPSAIPKDQIQSELARLEQEHKKGLALLQNLQSQAQATQADLLKIEGAILTLRSLLKDSAGKINSVQNAST